MSLRPRRTNDGGGRDASRASTSGIAAPPERGRTLFSVLSSFFGWLYRNEKIARNPLDRTERPRRLPPEDLDIVSVTTADVPLLLAETKPGT